VSRVDTAVGWLLYRLLLIVDRVQAWLVAAWRKRQPR